MRLLRAIESWQANPDRVRGLCQQTPTCSVYGHRAISRYGVLRGGIMTAGRVLRCNGCLVRGEAAAAPRKHMGD